MSTSSSSTNIKIPSNFPEEVKDWKRDHVQGFLNANKAEYDLDGDDLAHIRDQKISGMDFLDVTNEKLAQYGLVGGPVARILKLVGELKNAKGIVEPGK